MIAFERVCAPGGPAKWCVAADIAGGMSIIDLDCRRSEPSFESVYEIGGRRIACSMLHSTVFAASCSCGVVAAYTRDSGKEMWRKGIDTPQMLTVSDATETLFATTEDQCVLEIGMRDGRVRASREGVKAVWISDDGAALFFEHAREIEVFHLGSDVLQIPKRSFAILAMATNANTVAVSEADGNVYYWDLATASLQLVATMGKESSIVTCAWSSFHNAFLGIEKGTTAQARLIKIGPDLATSPCLDEYYVWYAEEALDVLDHGAANIEYFNGHVLSVREWVLLASSIPDCDLFKAIPIAWIINQTLVDKFTAEGVTGCKFTRLATTGAFNRRF